MQEGDMGVYGYEPVGGATGVPQTLREIGERSSTLPKPGSVEAAKLYRATALFDILGKAAATGALAQPRQESGQVSANSWNVLPQFNPSPAAHFGNDLLPVRPRRFRGRRA